MIAVVSSTIFPEPATDGTSRSVFDPAERLQQTCHTIASLRAIGISEIHVADNSGRNWISGTGETLAPATIHRFTHYQFQNKGIAELFLLLEVLSRLPADTPLLKISGRYVLHRNITPFLGGAEVAVRWYDDTSTISTRCYMIQNARVYRRFLEDTLNEVYAYAARICGPRSLMRIVRNSIFAAGDATTYFDPPVSIERAAARALVGKKYSWTRVPDLSLEGEVAISRDRIRE